MIYYRKYVNYMWKVGESFFSLFILKGKLIKNLLYFCLSCLVVKIDLLVVRKYMEKIKLLYSVRLEC